MTELAKCEFDSAAKPPIDLSIRHKATGVMAPSLLTHAGLT